MDGYDIATIGDLGDAAPCCGPCSAGEPCAGLSLGDIEGLLPTFVTPAVVKALKLRLDPKFKATDADIRGCTSLDPRDRASWDLFFGSWKTYRDSEETFWGVKSEYDAGEAFEVALLAWQQKVEGTCRLSAPKVTPPIDQTGAALDLAKWGVIAVGLLAVAYLASPLIMGARKFAR